MLSCEASTNRLFGWTGIENHMIVLKISFPELDEFNGWIPGGFPCPAVQCSSLAVLLFSIKGKHCQRPLLGSSGHLYWCRQVNTIIQWQHGTKNLNGMSPLPLYNQDKDKICVQSAPSKLNLSAGCLQISVLRIFICFSSSERPYSAEDLTTLLERKSQK